MGGCSVYIRLSIIRFDSRFFVCYDPAGRGLYVCVCVRVLVAFVCFSLALYPVLLRMQLMAACFSSCGTFTFLPFAAVFWRWTVCLVKGGVGYWFHHPHWLWLNPHCCITLVVGGGDGGGACACACETFGACRHSSSTMGISPPFFSNLSRLGLPWR